MRVRSGILLRRRRECRRIVIAPAVALPSTFRAVRGSSSPDRRRISLRRWVRLIPGILNAKAAIACARRLTLLEAREAAILTAAAAASATVIGAPRIEDHRRARLRTRRQRDCDRSGQQSEFGRHCHSPSDRRLLLRGQMAIERVRKKPGSLHMRTQRRDISLLCLCTQDPAKRTSVLP